MVSGAGPLAFEPPTEARIPRPLHHRVGRIGVREILVIVALLLALMAWFRPYWTKGHDTATPSNPETAQGVK
jgi:hypothetical protein